MSTKTASERKHNEEIKTCKKLEMQLGELVKLAIKTERARISSHAIPRQTKQVPSGIFCCAGNTTHPLSLKPDLSRTPEQDDEKPFSEDIESMKRDILKTIEEYRSSGELAMAINAKSPPPLSSTSKKKPQRSRVSGIPEKKTNNSAEREVSFFSSPSLNCRRSSSYAVEKAISRKTSALREMLFEYGSFLTQVKDDAAFVLPDQFQAEIEMIRNVDEEECFDFLIQTKSIYLELMFVSKSEPSQ